MFLKIVEKLFHPKAQTQRERERDTKRGYEIINKVHAEQHPLESYLLLIAMIPFVFKRMFIAHAIPDNAFILFRRLSFFIL